MKFLPDRIALILVMAAVFLGFCPQLSGARQLPALVSNGGTMRSFSDAVNIPLKTDADYNRFVDPQISGRDRLRAIGFLKLMPANKRGDFIYVQLSGKIFSNRADAAGWGRFRRTGPARIAARTSRSMARRGLHPNDYSPPQPICPGGACIRNYSTQGINAMLGYASPPCDISLQSSEAGNMYFNAYDSTGHDVVDAGLATGLVTAGPPNSVSAFVNVAGSGYQGGFVWKNTSHWWPCGSPIGVLYGSLPASTPPSTPMSILALGIPAYDPRQVWLPPATETWTNGAWIFYNTSPDLLESPGSWEGTPSNCTVCTVARMFTLSQKNPSQDGSCYGACNPLVGPDGRWDETVAGQIINPCSGDSQGMTCTIMDTSAWFAGEFDNSDGIFFSEFNQQSGLEGIDIPYGGTNPSNADQGKFAWPLPNAPSQPCNADAKGLCTTLVSKTQIGQCNTGLNGVHGPIYVYLYKTTYYVFQQETMLELLETASSTDHAGNSHCEPVTDTWSPNEPSKFYNDPNLP